jgi:hypothetical protein
MNIRKVLLIDENDNKLAIEDFKETENNKMFTTKVITNGTVLENDNIALYDVIAVKIKLCDRSKFENIVKKKISNIKKKMDDTLKEKIAFAIIGDEANVQEEVINEFNHMSDNTINKHLYESLGINAFTKLNFETGNMEEGIEKILYYDCIETAYCDKKMYLLFPFTNLPSVAFHDSTAFIKNLLPDSMDHKFDGEFAAMLNEGIKSNNNKYEKLKVKDRRSRSSSFTLFESKKEKKEKQLEPRDEPKKKYVLRRRSCG